MAYQLVQINFFAVLLCVLFAAYILVDHCFSDKVRLLFFLSICAILALIVVDDIEYVQLHMSCAGVSRYVETSLGYIIRPLIAILVIGIFKETNNNDNNLKSEIVFLLPYVINVIAVATSPWNKLVYSYTSDGQFVRGPIGYITFIVGFFYMGYMLYISVKIVEIKKRGEVLVIGIMASLCFIGTMMESLYQFVGFLSGSSIIGVVLYYLFLHVSIYSLDDLTGTYNRTIFFLDVKKIREPVILVSMDLNDLKKINDSKGHKKGDEFIRLFAREIFRRKSKASHFYRIGGDEFVLICRNISRDTVDEKLREVQNTLGEKGYSFAYGQVQLTRDDDIETCLSEADQLMYQKKNKMKNKVSE